MTNLPIGQSGQILTSDGTGNIKWANYPFIVEFDDAWSNKYALKCERMCERLAVGVDANYGSVYKLCELLWKLKVWKP